MPSTSALVLLGSLLAYGVFYYIQGLRSNLAAARRSGLPYVVVPTSPFSFPWQLTSGLWTPLIKLLPRSCWEQWLDILQPDWSFRYLRGPWDRLGDTFLVVSPRGIILYTCDAEAIFQVTSRREAFPKQTVNYELLAIFGRNMISTEGPEWKMHRKGVSASFNERNAAHIFVESIKQTQGMIAYWMDSTADEEAREEKRASSGTINTLEHDTMTLALNIIAHVGFGLRLLWPGQKMPADMDQRSKQYASLEPPEGHSMTFADSLATVLERILLLLIVPPWLLKAVPFSAARSAANARWNYEKYMQEFLHNKIEDAQHEEDNSEDRGMDIMGQMVRAKYGKKSQQKKTANGKGSEGGSPLSDSDIFGNSFVILVAGHETTANTLHFTLIELANNPAAQRALQADVERLLGKDSDPLNWEYEGNINALMGSNVAACMNEVLRLTPSVVDIPKEPNGQGQSIVLAGHRHVVPRGTTIILNSVGAQRNPRYWPTKPGKTGAKDDLDEFVPERWYRPSLHTKAEATAAHDQEEEEDFGGFKGPDTSAQLYRPVRGSFIPFSDGARSCLGRRIAQVEMVAALAVLFQRYSVELAVDEWASDEEVERMGDDEKRSLYEKARKKSRETVRQASSLLTLKLHGHLKVPVRTDGLKKSDLEAALQDHLAEHQNLYGSHPRAVPYYQSRARAIGSPVKKEGPAGEPKKRRNTSKSAEPPKVIEQALAALADDDSEHQSSTATPGPLTLARRIPLPTSPADVARVVDERTLALRERVSTLYDESGIKEATYNTRDALSTVTSILFCINAFELYNLRKEILTDRYAFTIPAVKAIGTSDYAVEIPDMFLLLTSSFWNPALLWAFTSIILPAFFGFYFNLSAAHQSTSRRRSGQPDYVIDPLTFSIAKAVITYVVYQQGATFGGWVDPVSVARINSAIYGGWKGVLTGAFISGVASFYDAVLRK
ncbi:hypothetical protein M406DRAFT_348284 [Cryphonectria parasitica EP155]|uniref:Cytochrome P450 n=1 Tax=Cryphonectria parasitica (strain ATCC 38755 / EP155) TaxID=660469 RepID=A0A9P4XTN6_CRYP1|nr:uncharacterized protein M406DRAFT_348284 [Cryphonectria parasitica EP155]KAF3760814.1 hypothetical protein M406DRAFT_348284 [Cryphonectria parasitica EP155]